MNLVLRLVLLMAGGVAVFSATTGPTATLGTIVASAAVGASLLGAVAAHLHWHRPASDAIAWTGGIVYLFTLGAVDAGASTTALLSAGVLLLVAGLHVAPAGSPPMDLRSTALTWPLVGVAVFLIAWGPEILSQDEVSVLDPTTSTGAALRLAAATGVLAASAALLSLRKRRALEPTSPDGL